MRSDISDSVLRPDLLSRIASRKCTVETAKKESSLRDIYCVISIISSFIRQSFAYRKGTHVDRSSEIKLSAAMRLRRCGCYREHGVGSSPLEKIKIRVPYDRN